MKYLYVILLILPFFACDPEGDPLDDCFLCEEFPFNPSVDLAEGEISVQNAGPKEVFQVDSASLQWLEENRYVLSYYFTSGDYLDIYIAEVTHDFNYHFPKPIEENQILEVYFDDELLDLDNAALSLQPRPSEGSFHTVVNIHTLNAGDWNGTVNKVPLVE